jgi:hypothetical protein
MHVNLPKSCGIISNSSGRTNRQSHLVSPVRSGSNRRFTTVPREQHDPKGREKIMLKQRDEIMSHGAGSFRREACLQLRGLYYLHAVQAYTSPAQDGAR